MLEHIKKNKEIKFSSFLLTGISNNNIFSKCGCICKGKEEINNNNTNKNINNNPTQDPIKGEKPPKDEKPQQNQEFLNSKNDLIKKVKNLEEKYLKFVPENEQTDTLSNFKSKLNLITKENIKQLKNEFNVIETNLNEVIKIHRKVFDLQELIEKNNIGKLIGSINKNLNCDFTIKDPTGEETENLNDLKSNLNKYLNDNNIEECCISEILHDESYHYFVCNIDKILKLDVKLQNKIKECYEKNTAKKFFYLIKDSSNNIFFYDKINPKQYRETNKFEQLNSVDIEFIKKFFDTNGTTDAENVKIANDIIKGAVINFSERKIESKGVISDLYIVYFFNREILNKIKKDKQLEKYIKRLSFNLYSVTITVKVNGKVENRFREKDLSIDSFDKKTKTLTVTLS